MTNTTIADPRRRTEADPDYQRLQAQTEKRLHACIARLCSDLRTGRVQPTVAQSVFIHTATAVLEQAYTEAHAEGQRDYWQRVSQKPHAQPLVAPDERKMRHRLAFYAPSVARMAHEALLAHQASLAGRRLAEVLPERAGVIMRLDAGGGHAPGYEQNRDGHGRFAPGNGRADSGGGGSSGGEEEGGTRAEGGTRGTRGQGRGARSGGASGAGGGRGGARARRQGQPQDEQQQARRQQQQARQQREEAQRAEQEGHARAEEMHQRAVERRGGGQRRAGGGASRRAQPTAEERAARELEDAKANHERTQRYVQQMQARVDRAGTEASKARAREDAAPEKAREALRKEAIAQAKRDGTPEYREYQKALREQKAAQRAVDKGQSAYDKASVEYMRVTREAHAQGMENAADHPEYQAKWDELVRIDNAAESLYTRKDAADKALKAAEDRVVGDRANDAAVANHPIVQHAHEAGEQARGNLAQALREHENARRYEHEAAARVARAQGMTAVATGGKGVRIAYGTETYTNEARTKEAIKEVFGRALSEEELVALSGAQIGDHITVNGAVSEFGTDLRVQVGGGAFERDFSVSREGHQVILHDDYTGNTGQKSANSGADIVRGMENMQRVGVTRVVCDAAGSYGARMNGYYTWAKLGFTGRIPTAMMDLHVIADMRAKFGNVTRVEQLMQKPGGSQWWKRNGVAWEASFSFKNPYSIRTLARFRAIVERHGGGASNSEGE